MGGSHCFASGNQRWQWKNHYLEVSINGGTPIAGCFVMEILSMDEN